MKKFYTSMVLAAAVALSASAAPGTLGKKALSNAKNLQISQQTEAVMIPAAPATSTVKKSPVAKAKPTKVEDLYGYYTVSGYWYVGSSYPTTLNVILAPGEKDNEVLVSGLGVFDYIPVTGVFDATEGTLSIANDQPTTTSDYTQDGTNYGKVILYHIVLDPETSKLAYSETPFVLKFDDEGNLYSDQYDGFLEGLEKAERFTGFGGLGGLFSAKTQPLSNEGWEDAGNATFTDGWFSPAVQYFFFADSQGYPAIANEIPAFDVPLQRNTKDPNLYRLVDPWGGDYNTIVSQAEGYTDEYNTSFVNGCVEFTIEDPSCVVVTPYVYSGAYDDITGLGQMYMTNQAGYMIYNSMAEDPDKTIAEWIEEYKGFMSDEPGYKFSTYDSNSHMVIINDAMFTYPMVDSYGLYTWTDCLDDFKSGSYAYMFASYPATIDMTSIIMIPDPAGVENIIMDKTNSTLEYFNLQGVRVANPSNGIYIRRQGNDVRKVYVR